MYPQFLIALLIVCSFTLRAQKVQKRSHKIKSATVSYFSLYPQSDVVGILIAFGGPNPESVCSDLSNLAEQLSYRVVVPNIDLSVEKNRLAFKVLIGQWLDSVHGRVTLACLDQGWTAAGFAADLGLPMLVVHPLPPMGLNHWPRALDTPVAIFGNAQYEFATALRDSLLHRGAWVSLYAGNSESRYHYTGSEVHYAFALVQMDSLRWALSDPQERKRLDEAAGLRTQVPEEMPQGTMLDLNFFITRHGYYTVVIQDLGGKSIQSDVYRLSKGMQRILLSTDKLDWGVYSLSIVGENIMERHKFMIRG